jgi:hypothetical protein
MHRHAARARISVSIAVVLGLTALGGCSQDVNPAGPSSSSGAETSAVTAAIEAPASLSHAGGVASEHEQLIARASAGHLTPADLMNRRWSCFQPLPERIVCSAPNQGFPAVGTPPPDDRPASFTFLVFDGSNRFTGTEVLLRTDLYKGQLCESTNQPYDLVSVIGYYECVHTAGR